MTTLNPEDGTEFKLSSKKRDIKAHEKTADLSFTYSTPPVLKKVSHSCCEMTN